jgi:hypothetical protein
MLIEQPGAAGRIEIRRSERHVATPARQAMRSAC